MRRIVLPVLALLLFVFALDLMQDGARGTAPFLRKAFHLQGVLNSLGFGWLAAYFAGGGSPVAAAALPLFDSGAVGRDATFAMIVGSRLGASLIVLLVGFVYVLAGRERERSLSLGALALLVTATTYLPALVLGLGLLRLELFGELAVHLPTLSESFRGRVFAPVSDPVAGVLPDWGLFVLGVGLVVASLKLFDAAVPDLEEKETRPRLLRRLSASRWWMFVLGAGLTLATLSVTVSLGLLVPLTTRRLVRRTHLVPYVMGANVTTLADTLMAAMILGRSEAVGVVVVGIAAIVASSLGVLALGLGRYEEWMLGASEWVTSSRRNLAVFLTLLFFLPLALLLL